MGKEEKINTLCTSIVPQRPRLPADLPVDGSAVSLPTITIFTFNHSSLLALSAAIPKFKRSPVQFLTIIRTPAGVAIALYLKLLLSQERKI